MRWSWWIVLVVLAACPAAKKKGPAPLKDPVSSGERDQRADLVAELQDDILKSYDRDEPPESENSMVPPDIGTARIGVGPGDVLVGKELERAPSRWPLDLDPSQEAEPRSKRLELHLSKDQTSAWVTDEISWRIKACGRTAVIPMRMSALYARDGDRWVPVFEHLSFARPATPTKAGQKIPRELRTAVSSRDLADELSRTLGPLLRRALDKSPKVIGQGPDASLIGPDVNSEWHAGDTVIAKVLPGTEPMRLEDRRVGVVGRNADKATVAFWVGNLTADLPARGVVPAGKGHFRATFVFEKRDGAWVIVQGHVSHAIDDETLGAVVFGTSLISPKPLQISCDDGSRR